MSLQLSAPLPLAATHILDDFACGEASLDEWLERRALTNQLSGASRTFVVTHQEGRVYGYCAMAAAAAIAPSGNQQRAAKHARPGAGDGSGPLGR
jgi:hypothetical protein